ncbi:MAG TPA: hypothetical protein PLX85_04800, partial [Dehalococcoidia bacterium]|nr:hypothetical protein [Dehalococcoidia bacterium]
RIAASTQTQRLTCPSGAETTAELWMIEPCQGRAPGSDVEVYEFHTGKGPVFFGDREAYIAAVFQGLSPGGSDIVMLAVGCGVPKSVPASSADCATEGVAVYRNLRYSSEVALVFSRRSDTDRWMIEKFWSIFPSTVPETIPGGLRLEINTIAGVSAVELYPYSPE